jgi:hypothetical protein
MIVENEKQRCIVDLGVDRKLLCVRDKRTIAVGCTRRRLFSEEDGEVDPFKVFDTTFDDSFE